MVSVCLQHEDLDAIAWPASEKPLLYRCPSTILRNSFRCSKERRIGNDLWDQETEVRNIPKRLCCRLRCDSMQSLFRHDDGNDHFHQISSFASLHAAAPAPSGFWTQATRVKTLFNTDGLLLLCLFKLEFVVGSPSSMLISPQGFSPFVPYLFFPVPFVQVLPVSPFVLTSQTILPGQTIVT